MTARASLKPANGRSGRWSGSDLPNTFSPRAPAPIQVLVPVRRRKRQRQCCPLPGPRPPLPLPGRPPRIRWPAPCQAACPPPSALPYPGGRAAMPAAAAPLCRSYVTPWSAAGGASPPGRRDLAAMAGSPSGRRRLFADQGQPARQGSDSTRQPLRCRQETTHDTRRGSLRVLKRHLSHAMTTAAEHRKPPGRLDMAASLPGWGQQ